MPLTNSKRPKRKAAGSVQSIAATSQLKREHFTMLLNRHAGNDVNIQCTRLYLAMQFSPVTTFEARKYLDVIAPAQRIKEMRESGMSIDTLLVNIKTDARIIHRRVAMYVLQGGEL